MIDETGPSGIVIGIDASRNRSGGAKAHLIGILKSFDPRALGVSQVHVWSYPKLLAALPDEPWIIKHAPPELDMSIFRQIWWQLTQLHAHAKALGCHIMLNTGAGTLSRFKPSVTMSRDMLSFEHGEMQRYPLFSKARLRLFSIKHLQIHALRKATGVIFLTEYAANALQKFTGYLPFYRIIPHGISESFRQKPIPGYWAGERSHIRCVYVSNSDLYKHQWHVIEAISILRRKGHPVTIDLIGGGQGLGWDMTRAAIAQHDPNGTFVHSIGAVAHEEIPRHLAQADIFVFASSCENMPNTLIEGMASSLPIASSDRGPMREILGDAGAYFDPEQPDSIANAIEQLLTDTARRQTCTQEASRAAGKYSWKRCSRETFSFLVDVARANLKKSSS